MPRDDDHHGQAFIGLVATTRPDTSADATRMERAGMIQTDQRIRGTQGRRPLPHTTSACAGMPAPAHSLMQAAQAPQGRPSGRVSRRPPTNRVAEQADASKRYSTGQDASSCEVSSLRRWRFLLQDRGGGAPERRPGGRVSRRPPTNRVAEEADVSKARFDAPRRRFVRASSLGREHFLLKDRGAGRRKGGQVAGFAGRPADERVAEAVKPADLVTPPRVGRPPDNADAQGSTGCSRSTRPTAASSAMRKIPSAATCWSSTRRR